MASRCAAQLGLQGQIGAFGIKNKTPPGLLSYCTQGSSVSLSLLQSERQRLRLHRGHSGSRYLWVCSGACKEVGSLFSPPVTHSCVFRLLRRFLLSEDGCLSLVRTSQTLFDLKFSPVIFFVFFSRPIKVKTPFQSMPVLYKLAATFSSGCFQIKANRVVERELQAGKKN